MAKRANEIVDAEVETGYVEPTDVDVNRYEGEPKEVSIAVIPDNANLIVSPLVRQDTTGGLRPRKGWHQTWKRSDEFREAMDMGYRQIRRRKPTDPPEPGMETGQVIAKADGANDIIAMEIREDAYQLHIAAIAAKSHRAYNDPDLVLREFSQRTNRDMSSRKEQVHLKVDYEQQQEVLHKR